MSTETPTKTEHRCRYCDKTFQRESTLAVHVCEQKKRFQEEKETGVQLGLQAWLRFYEITQGSARLKTFDDFARSSYYRAFVKFGRYIQAIRAVNPNRFIEWVIRQNKKLDHWCQDKVYTEYLHQQVREEHVNDALARALEESIKWEEETGNPAKDYLRYGNANKVCHAIVNGRITAWVLFNCDSGNEFLGNLNQEQIGIVYPWVDADFWAKKFRDYPADQEYAREMLTQAGW